MSSIVGMCSFHLKGGVSVPDFLIAHEKYNREFVSKQKGYIAHMLLVDGNKWADLVTWESMEDTQSTFEATQESIETAEIMSLIDQIGTDDDIPLYSLERTFSDKGHTMSPGAIWFISYKLVEGASVPDFVIAAENCNNEVISKKKGIISWDVLIDGDTWVDLVAWETMEDAKNEESDDGIPDPVAQKFYSFIDFSSLAHQVYSVEKIY